MFLAQPHEKTTLPFCLELPRLLLMVAERLGRLSCQMTGAQDYGVEQMVWQLKVAQEQIQSRAAVLKLQPQVLPVAK